MRCDCLRKFEGRIATLITRRTTREIRSAKRELLQLTGAVATSIELVAQELARRCEAAKEVE